MVRSRNLNFMCVIPPVVWWRKERINSQRSKALVCLLKASCIDGEDSPSHAGPRRLGVGQTIDQLRGQAQAQSLSLRRSRPPSHPFAIRTLQGSRTISVSAPTLVEHL